ncbi:MAG TPA: PilZ domain-containing protein [Acetobacteraceae bacterium]
MSAPTAAEFQTSEAADNRRVAQRTFLMLAATARCGGQSLPIRIRNVSETGALIEGETLPAAGDPIHLSRGETEIDGVVAWASGIRRGVHFSHPVPVDTWRSGKPVAPQPGQGRVDLIQAAVRSGQGQKAGPAAIPTEERWVGQLDARMGEEIAFVQRLIEALGDELVADPAILHRHAQVLQNIDLASQILGHLSRVIGAPERAAAVRAIGMEDLRARLTRHRNLG